MPYIWSEDIIPPSIISTGNGANQDLMPQLNFNPYCGDIDTSCAYNWDALHGYPALLKNGEGISSPHPHPHLLSNSVNSASPSSSYAPSSQGTDFGSPDLSPVLSNSTPSPIPSPRFYDTTQPFQTGLTVLQLNYLQLGQADSFLPTFSNPSLQSTGMHLVGPANNAFRPFVGSLSMRKAGKARRKHGKATFACEIPSCGADFTSPSNLKAHLKSHFGIRDIVCWSCGKAFGIKHVWKRHLKSLACRRQRSKLLQSTERPAGHH